MGSSKNGWIRAQGVRGNLSNKFTSMQALESEATAADEQIQKGGVLDDATNGIKDQLDALKSAFGLQ